MTASFGWSGEYVDIASFSFGGSELVRGASSSHDHSISLERLPHQRLFHHPLVEIISLSFPIFCFAYVVLLCSGVNASWSNAFVDHTIILAVKDVCLPTSTLDKSFDLVRSFDLVQSFDLVWSFDIVWSFDLVQSFDLVRSFDLPMHARVAQDVVEDTLAQCTDGLGLMKNEDHQVLRNEQKLEEDASDCIRVDDDGVEFSPEGGDYFPIMGDETKKDKCSIFLLLFIICIVLMLMDRASYGANIEPNKAGSEEVVDLDPDQLPTLAFVVLVSSIIPISNLSHKTFANTLVSNVSEFNKTTKK
ncbi:hypothetical protein Tco_0974130 [Tanacetum coccineum]|uniref:Uncharacterized protein n=1 Tax=Tanacetum coccineum TaxID=301880 RepID=A0ABQ5EAP3_9ASTR